MRGNLRAHRYRNGRDTSRLDSPLQQPHGLVAHRSARCENDSIRALVAQPFCYHWCRCIAQETTIWNKAHEAKVHGRYSSDDTHVNKFLQVRCRHYSASPSHKDAMTLQFSTHPIGLLRSMFVRDVVADVIAVFEHPEFRPAACLDCYALPLFRRHKPVAATLDDQERTCYPLCHALQVELLQLIERILFVSGFETVNHRFAAYARAVSEIRGLVVWPAIFDGRLYALLKCGGTYGKLTAKTDAHQAHAGCVYIWPALKVVNGVFYGHLVIVAQGKLEFQLSLSRTVDGQHRQAPPQKVIAIPVQPFLHGIKSGHENH